MAIKSPLCLSLYSTAVKGAQKGQETAGNRNLGGSPVASQIVVLHTTTAMSSCSSSTPHFPGYVNSRPCLAPVPEKLHLTLWLLRGDG